MVKVFAPATVANVAVGFDILGFALDRPGDEIVVRDSTKPGLRITAITGTGDKKLPLDPARNTAGFSALQLLHHLGEEQRGIEMEIHKKMPFGSGLGSSAASAAAGVFAVNELLGRPLCKQALLPFAVDGEQIADGAYHADNVAPSLLGGITFIRENASLDVHQLPIPDELCAAVVYPYVEVLTKEAREVLCDDAITLEKAILQTGNLGGLIVGLYESNYELISRSLNDVLIEPQRASLIPHFSAVKAAALNAGALGASISGAGPSVFCWCRGEEDAQRAGLAMCQIFQRNDVRCDLFVSPINQKGTIRLA